MRMTGEAINGDLHRPGPAFELSGLSLGLNFIDLRGRNGFRPEQGKKECGRKRKKC